MPIYDPINVNTDFTTQVGNQQIPLERMWVRRNLGLPSAEPVAQPEPVKQTPLFPERKLNTSYMSYSRPAPTPVANPESVAPTPVAPVVTPQSQGTNMFNLDDVMKSTIYLKNGIWVSDNPFVNRVLQMESGGNADAVAHFKGGAGRWDPSRKDRAAGLFQFTPGTGAEYGLVGDDRFDAQKSFQAFLRLTQSNANRLKARGIPITPTNLYLAHQQGVGGLSQILGAINNGRAISDGVIQNMRNNRRPGVAINASPQVWYDAWNNHVGL